jgi:osmotically inducible lipoprotein OsmB
MNRTSTNVKNTILVLSTVLLLSACSDMSKTQQRTLSGAGIGAGVGAVGTVMTGGCVSCGAVIGGAAGAGAGYVYDRTKKD